MNLGGLLWQMEKSAFVKLFSLHPIFIKPFMKRIFINKGRELPYNNGGDSDVFTFLVSGRNPVNLFSYILFFLQFK